MYSLDVGLAFTELDDIREIKRVGSRAGAGGQVQLTLMCVSDHLKFKPGSPGCYEGRRIKHILFSNWSAFFTPEIFRHMLYGPVDSCPSPTSINGRPA